MENVFKGQDENLKIRTLLNLDKSTLPPDGGAEFNRLIFATSPYLLQHADNPVDWYPWGDDAFEKASREDKPVMVSIGYATCHWCHVMEHESFEDPDVAGVINRCVVPVKVDREERPDIDTLYIASARILTGGNAGWPLTVFLAPDRKPFYAATYIPKKGAQGVLGIVETMEKIAEVWRTSRHLIDENCEAVLKALGEMAYAPATDVNHGEILDTSLATLGGMYDYLHGGFGEKPKFPLPHYLAFLLRMWQRTKNPDIEDIVGFTLRSMRDGGIYDQIGSGFHRYAVDQEWKIPHFEKMLYDQAVISLAYLEAYQAYGDDFLIETARELFRFALDEMRSPEGGFYSGLDADSEGREGAFYFWTHKELEECLGDDAVLFRQVFGMTEIGDAEGGAILRLVSSLAMVAKENDMEVTTLHERIDAARSRLLAVRNRRIRPFRDEKTLAGWNGLMIAALARGAVVCDDTEFLDAAESAARFVEQNLKDRSGRLLRSFHHRETAIPAFLEDYAFLCWGIIELYQASGKREYLVRALALADGMLVLFHDDANGGFFDTGRDAGETLVRMKSVFDGALPSGNSIACLCLLKLGKITYDDRLLQVGEKCLNSFLGSVKEQPIAHLQMVNALDFHLGPDIDITLVGAGGQPAMKALLGAVYRKFAPGLVLRFRQEGEHADYRMVDGQPTAYVCAKGACRPAVNTAEAFEHLLDEVI